MKSAANRSNFIWRSVRCRDMQRDYGTIFGCYLIHLIDSENKLDVNEIRLGGINGLRFREWRSISNCISHHTILFGLNNYFYFYSIIQCHIHSAKFEVNHRTLWWSLKLWMSYGFFSSSRNLSMSMFRSKRFETVIQSSPISCILIFVCV